MPTRRAIYPGTFDPITNGHLDLLNRASELFDEVIVAVAVNSTKTPLFSQSERLTLARRAINEELGNRTNISVDSFNGLLVDYATTKQAVAIVRGLRALTDFEYEFQMALTNRKLADAISTVFLMPHEQYTYLNSTIVRELARHHKIIDSFVPTCVKQALEEHFKD